MTLSESDTRAKLIDPALHLRGWTEDLIKREETAGGIEIVDGSARRKKGRTDYTLRVRVSANAHLSSALSISHAGRIVRAVSGRPPDFAHV